MKRRKHRNLEVQGVVENLKSGPLVIASDASDMRPWVGLAWIATSGHWGTKFHLYPQEYGGSDTTNIAELRAMAYAWEHIKPSGPVRLMTDNKIARSFLIKWRQGDLTLPRHYRAERVNGKTPKLVHFSRQLATHGREQITVEYVPAHVGHPLNECADTLASLGKRKFTKQEVEAMAPTMVRNRLSDWK